MRLSEFWGVKYPGLTDLADGRRIASVQYFFFNIVQYLLLLFTDSASCHIFTSVSFRITVLVFLY